MKTNLHNVLKELRKQNGKTQQEIADILQITQKAYSNYEKGTRLPDIEKILDLAEYYKVPIDVLVGRYKL